jgi:hypothetical protein
MAWATNRGTLPPATAAAMIASQMTAQAMGSIGMALRQ